MDKATWQHIINGDKDAYAALYKSYFKKFYNYGHKFTANVAIVEDSIQEVFLDVWSKKEKMLEVESTGSYFFSAFRFTLLKKIKQSYQPLQLNALEDEPQFSVEQAIIEGEINKDLQQKLQAGLNTLTSRQREAIFLRFYESLSYEEVAAVLNISVKATYKIMARSLQSLKEALNVPLKVILLLLKLFYC
jgi:RNA polymerase sigma factor (sigma-70 family)